LNFLRAFQNRQVQILCSYWMRDFLELRRELLKAGQSQVNGFEIRQIFFGLNNSFSFEKRAAQHPPLLNAAQGLSCRFSKAFCKFKSFSR
jgi:hypothetical protein